MNERTPHQKKIDDYIAAGFHQLDPENVKAHPPKIKWSMLYKDWSDEKKIQYLEKLAATMNHAARLVQDERDALAKVCELKEKELSSVKAAFLQNTDLLQSEISRMNEDRQHYNKSIADLNAELRALKNGNLN